MTDEEKSIDDYACFDIIETLVTEYSYSEKLAIQICIAMYLEDVLAKL